MSLRLLIEPSGKVYLSFAKRKLAEMKDFMRQMGVKSFSRHFWKGTDTRIWVESMNTGIEGNTLDWIRIKSGCKDTFEGFLVYGDGSGQFFASFDDGVTVEKVFPVPSPDDRVKLPGYTLPAKIRTAAFGSKTASKYTGLMRQLVGCYHNRGLDDPFSFTHELTHGLVKDPEGSHWVVEIARTGVYAARIKMTKRCCDSGSIKRYTPTDAEVAAGAPSSAQTTLSLAWAFTAVDEAGKRTRPGIVELLPSAEITAAFVLGNPWYADQGWAFNYSGTRCQQVIVDTFINPNIAPPFGQAPVGSLSYRGTRHVIDFTWATVDGSREITGTLTTPDLKKIGTLNLNAPVASPTSETIWFLENLILTLPLPDVDNYSEDMPVHVYYDGDQEVVTRFKTLILPVTEGEVNPADVPFSSRKVTMGFQSSKFSTLALYNTYRFWTNRTPIPPTPPETESTEDSITLNSVAGTRRGSFGILTADRESSIDILDFSFKEAFTADITVPTDLFSAAIEGTTIITDLASIDSHMEFGPNFVNSGDLTGTVFFAGFDPDDFFKHDLTTFILGTTGTITSPVISRVYAVHGNLWRTYPTGAEPSSEYPNAAYTFLPGARTAPGVFDHGVQHTIGGFTPPPIPPAFTNDAVLGFVEKPIKEPTP